jgi:hypothetical protein
MPGTTAHAPTVYLLADNLDAALAAGEDMLKSRHDPTLPAGIGEAELTARLAERQRFIDRLRTLELTLIQRVLLAREYAGELAHADGRFKMIAGLFVSGSSPLLDAVADLGVRSDIDDPLHLDAVAYLRSRGVIGEEVAGLEGIADIQIAETFMVSERIALGPLLDLIATFLDSLELHYDLFKQDEDAGLPARSLAEAIAALR